MRFHDSFQKFNQKQISILLHKSANLSNHYNLSDIKESNRFNETQNIESTVYLAGGGGKSTLPADPSPAVVLSE